MDWNLLGALGEIVGGLGVVVSLVYLGSQIRFSTRSANAESTRAMAKQLQELLLLDDRLWMWIDLWLRGERSEAVRSNVDNGFRMVFDVYESMWIAVQSGTVDEAYSSRLFERYLPYTLSAGLGRECWQRVKVTYDPGFATFVDEFLERAPPPTSDEDMIAWFDVQRRYRPDLFAPAA
jgi:hypothetical protein